MSDLITTPPALWEVSSEIKDRTRDHKIVKVRVTKLSHGGRTIMTMEGQLAYDSLLKLAADYNRMGLIPKLHKKSFADLPTEGARAKASLKHI